MNLLRLAQDLKQNLVFWELAKILTVFNRHFLAPILGDKVSPLQNRCFFNRVFTRPHDRQLLIWNMMREKYCWHKQDSERVNSVYRLAEVFWLVKKLTDCITANIPILIIPFLRLPSL